MSVTVNRPHLGTESSTRAGAEGRRLVRSTRFDSPFSAMARERLKIPEATPSATTMESGKAHDPCLWCFLGRVSRAIVLRLSHKNVRGE